MLRDPNRAHILDRSREGLGVWSVWSQTPDTSITPVPVVPLQCSMDKGLGSLEQTVLSTQGSALGRTSTSPCYLCTCKSAHLSLKGI